MCSLKHPLFCVLFGQLLCLIGWNVARSWYVEMILFLRPLSSAMRLTRFIGQIYERWTSRKYSIVQAKHPKCSGLFDLSGIASDSGWQTAAQHVGCGLLGMSA